MPITKALNGFKMSASQCDSLIASAHRQDAAGRFLFSSLDREQITSAAFLNLFIAWEMFLEDSITSMMAGAPTIGGVSPHKFVSPKSSDDAKGLVVGTYTNSHKF